MQPPKKPAQGHPGASECVGVNKGNPQYKQVAGKRYTKTVLMEAKGGGIK
ncbi:MAG: hypothetical protein Ct9H90mP9_3320 [Pseudomonadota bacterium]|nr:MAG: hypothetical protein Ct9H90mP9_3320 [Pseudomonadota bacterium]